MYTYPDEQIAYNAMAESEVGGGPGYNWPDRPSPSQADAVVTSGSQFYSACRNSNVTYVYIPGNTACNIGNDSVRIRDKKIIYGDGPESGSLLYSNTTGEYSQAYRGGDATGHIALNGDVRITGIEARGHHHNYWSDKRWPGFDPLRPSQNRSAWYGKLQRFASCYSSPARIDNCKIRGWTYESISCGTSTNAPTNVEIDHNKITDNMLTSGGYCFTTYYGLPHLHHNYLSGARHAVNGHSSWNCGYICENNLFGPYFSSHQIDMHGRHNNFNSGSTNYSSQTYWGQAGGNCVIRNNTFMAMFIHDEPQSFDYGKSNPNYPAWPIAWRGTPWPRSSNGLIIEKNRFLNPALRSNDPNYRNPRDRRAVTQQLSGGNWSIPSSQRGSDNFSVNIEYSQLDNMYEAAGKDYDPEYGAPVAIEGELTEPTAQLRVYAEDDESGERINGADVTIDQL